MNNELSLSERFYEKLKENEKWLVNVDQVFTNVIDYLHSSPRFFRNIRIMEYFMLGRCWICAIN